MTSYFLKKILFTLERGERREKKRDRNINVWLPLTLPPMGTWPVTQAGALTGNRTSDPLVRRPVLSPLSHTSQGQHPIVSYSDGLVVYLSVHTSMHLSIHASICLSVHLFILPSVCPSIHPSIIHLSIYLSTQLMFVEHFLCTGPWVIPDLSCP